MTEYALCYVENPEPENEVLVVRKQKPDWQKGFLNLPGGKIEPGESPCGAAKRELMEEAGLDSRIQSVVGVLEGPDWRVHVVRCANISGIARTLTDEQVSWIPLDGFQHFKLIENLNLIVPLCHFNITGWKFTTHGPEYTITL